MDATKIVSAEDAQKVVGILQNAGTQKLITAAGLLVVLLVASHFIVKLFKRFLNSTRLINKSLHTLLTYFIRYMLILLSLMVAANSVGVPITTFVALFSILGVALTLALQGVLSNIAGCLILVTGRQFGVGDFIQTSNGSGTVKDIGLLYTELAAPDGTTVYLPNSTLYTAPLTNVTSNGKRRIAQIYTAAYQHSPDEVRAALQEAVSKLTTLLPDPVPNIVVDGYARTYVNYKVFCWTATGDYWPTLQKLNELVYKSFAEHGIEWADPKVAVVTTD